MAAGDELELPFCRVPVPEAIKGQLDELDRERDGEGMRSQTVVNLDARSRGARRPGLMSPKVPGRVSDSVSP